MKRGLRLAAMSFAVVALIVTSAGGASAKGKWASATASVLDDGRLQVSFVETGLKSATSYRLRADFFIDWTCDGIWAGDTGGGGPSWNTPQQFGTFTATKGKGWSIAGTLTHPIVVPSDSGWLKCPDGNPAFLADIEWTAITVTDLTNSKDISVASVSRTF